MNDMTPKSVIERYRRAKDRRAAWESHWQECYDYAMPQREAGTQLLEAGNKRTDKIFDATAPDAVDQLAASLLAHLTPPWARWFGFTAGPQARDLDLAAIGAEMEAAATIMQSHFDRSNFAVELHQCYLDLVTAGSACLLFEEASAGNSSAFRFTAVPLSQVVFEESAFGQLDTTFRRSELTPSQFRARFPEANLPEALKARDQADPEYKLGIIEAVVPEKPGFAYLAVLETPGATDTPTILAKGRFSVSPFINFRWLKAPGEIYGRSPVMKALPDIKTANKVVELVLKNASIAVTGIWQADDDGVLNPATIKLTPGTIIPKAVGSQGLTPLTAPGRFDVSNILLTELRANIRKAMLSDKLGQPESPKMTATEILERSADMSRLLGATYGRLQSELLTPLIERGLSILTRRGEVEGLRVDGRIVDLEYKSPMARQQVREDAQNTIRWLEVVQAFGPAATAALDPVAAAQWLGRAFGVPAELLSGGENAPIDGAAEELLASPDLMAALGIGPETPAGSGQVTAHDPVVRALESRVLTKAAMPDVPREAGADG